jgi:hypothetical protein
MTDADEIERLARELCEAMWETCPPAADGTINIGLVHWDRGARFILTREQGLREERDRLRSALRAAENTLRDEGFIDEANSAEAADVGPDDATR